MHSTFLLGFRASFSHYLKYLGVYYSYNKSLVKHGNLTLHAYSLMEGHRKHQLPIELCVLLSSYNSFEKKQKISAGTTNWNKYADVSRR